ncbi:conserved Plasmodium protein, unknown function [Plasmodium gallinaceum]|uniref:Uncharacterized protein n=1 Tax=Plasmodium gallinaceum TaxID=5849 RepID=A0A1J1GRJ5_PLAGA|nr:conserved Plasmodium protein, unknown function [Plasmodium gallinaceum]CRG94915.1 conserved Plasmodium protein, unknown function [Plasmodium gallinaceum]
MIGNELCKSNNVHLYNGNNYKPFKCEKENLYQYIYLNDNENYNKGNNNNNNNVHIINEFSNNDNNNNSYVLISNENIINDYNNISSINKNRNIYDNNNNSNNNNTDKNGKNYDSNDNNRIDNIYNNNYESISNNDMMCNNFRDINNDNNNNSINNEYNNCDMNIHKNNSINNANNNNDINNENNNNNNDINRENNYNNDENNDNDMNYENNNNDINNEDKNNNNYENNINDINRENNYNNDENNDNNMNNENNNNDVNNEDNNNNNIYRDNRKNNDYINSDSIIDNISSNNNSNSKNDKDNINDIDENEINHKLKKSCSINYFLSENTTELFPYKNNNDCDWIKNKNEIKVPYDKRLQLSVSLKESNDDIKNLKNENISTKNFNKINKVVGYNNLKKINSYLYPKRYMQKLEKIKVEKKSKIEEEEKKLKTTQFLKNKNVSIFCENDKKREEYIKKTVTKKNYYFSKGFNKIFSSLRNNNTKKIENGLNKKKNILDTLSLERISVIPEKMKDEKDIKELIIEDNNNKINQKIQVYCKKDDNIQDNIISKYTDGIEKYNEETCVKDSSVSSSNYSFKIKTNIKYNKNDDLLENKRENSENVSFLKINELFKDSNFPVSILSKEQIVDGKKELSHKNECKIFASNFSLSSDGKKKEYKSIDYNLPKDKSMPNTLLGTKTILRSKCENIKNKNRTIDKNEKIDKYTIHISNLFSHSKDEFAEYMLENIDCNIKKNDNENIISKNKKKSSEESRKVNLDTSSEKKILINLKDPKENLKYKEVYYSVASSLNIPKNMKKNNYCIKNMNIMRHNEIGYKDYPNYNRRKTFFCPVNVDTHKCVRNPNLINKLSRKKKMNSINDKMKSNILLKLHLNLKDKSSGRNFDNSIKRTPNALFYDSTPMNHKSFGGLLSEKIENFSLHLPNSINKSRKLHTDYTLLREQINYDRKKVINANNKELMGKSKCFDRTVFTNNSSTLLNESTNLKFHPKYELIYKTPHNTRNSFYMRNSPMKTLK